MRQHTTLGGTTDVFPPLPARAGRDGAKHPILQAILMDLTAVIKLKCALLMTLLVLFRSWASPTQPPSAPRRP